MADNIYRVYDDLGGMMGELEINLSLIEMMILNGKNEKANRYLREAATEIRHARSDLSDAAFQWHYKFHQTVLDQSVLGRRTAIYGDRMIYDHYILYS